MVLFHLFFLLCTTNRPKVRVLIDLFRVFPHDHSIEIYGPPSVILSFVHDHSTKTQGLTDLCISFAHDLSTKIYGPLSFILSLCTTIRRKFRVLVNFFFYLHMIIQQKYMILFHLFFLCGRPFEEKLGSSLIQSFYLRTTIRPKLGVILTFQSIFFLVVLIFRLLYS